MENINSPAQNHITPQNQDLTQASTVPSNQTVIKPKSVLSQTNLILLALVSAIGFLIIQNRQLKSEVGVSSFETCVQAQGSILTESYPATCITKSGLKFVQQLTEINPIEFQTEPGLEPETLPSGMTQDLTSDQNQTRINSTGQTAEFSSTRVNSYHSPFSLKYPSSWRIKVESASSSNDDGSLTLTLTKPGAKILIQQGPMGAGGCLYPEDKAEEGMFSSYGPFIEIKKGELIWRIAAVQDSKPLVYGVCEYKPETGYFAALTKVGIAFLELTKDNAEIVEEFNQIIKSVKILP